MFLGWLLIVAVTGLVVGCGLAWGAPGLLGAAAVLLAIVIAATVTK